MFCGSAGRGRETDLKNVKTPWVNQSPELTAFGAVRSAGAVHAASRRWLSFFSLGVITVSRLHSIVFSVIAVCFIALAAFSADYQWPATRGGGWPKEADAQKILDDRFDKSSKQSLGSDTDTAAIKKAILADMVQPTGASVSEVRWLSPTLVMAKAGWHSGSLDRGTFYYVVEKKDADWKIVTHYLLAIS